MKKIITIILLLISIVCLSQTQGINGNNTKVLSNGNVQMVNGATLDNSDTDTLELIETNVKITGNLKTSGDLTYSFIHAVGSADSINWTTPGSTQNVYYKINTGAFISHDAVGITATGDSMRILTAGHYLVLIDLGATTTNANDRIRVKIYTNGIAQLTSVGRFIINSSGSTATIQPIMYFWYMVDIPANAWLSIRATNQTGARAITVRDFKLYVAKTPEQ